MTQRISKTSVSSVKRKLTNRLKKENRYTQDMDALIELCAGSYVVYQKICDEINDLDSVVVDLVSREGNPRPEMHPLFDAYNKASDTLRKNLSELLITPKAKTSNTRTRKESNIEAEDKLAKLVNDLNDLKDD